MKYSDYFVDQLVQMGYTHCFYVSGGNVMHLLESARTRMNCIAVTHEVSAAIAAEYFNVAKRGTNERALVMVTAGPGLTNLISGIAGAWLESRELLVVGGQARSNLLSRGQVRQVGHQEIDGVSIVKSITKAAMRIEKPISGYELGRLARLSATDRKGPVFLEVCLDTTLVDINPDDFKNVALNIEDVSTAFDSDSQVRECLGLLKKSIRPLLLIGGGLSYETFQEFLPIIEKLNLPVATTWNASDYLDYESLIYAGRPNTYGMRWANAVIQQCDLLISIGARLGLQQTGFNVQEFAPLAEVVRVDIDASELKRALPKSNISINSDANSFFKAFFNSNSLDSMYEQWLPWNNFISEIKSKLPVAEPANQIYDGHVNPFKFVENLSEILESTDAVIPCSSGGAYTSMMQAFKQKSGNLLTNNKGLASMGYGLAGALGTSVARKDGRVILIEGDGGFAQNLQELGTIANQNLNIKIFIFDNSGYASIRISQKAYFEGNYLGCDKQTGVELPDWKKLFDSFGIESQTISNSVFDNPSVLQALQEFGPRAFILKIHQDQPFLPKITSKVNNDGSITSNPIHLMQPTLPEDDSEKVFKFLPKHLRR